MEVGPEGRLQSRLFMVVCLKGRLQSRLFMELCPKERLQSILYGIMSERKVAE